MTIDWINFTPWVSFSEDDRTKHQKPIALCR